MNDKKTAIQQLQDHLVQLVMTYGKEAFKEALSNCYGVNLTGDLTDAKFLIPATTSNENSLECEVCKSKLVIASNQPNHEEIKRFIDVHSTCSVVELPDDTYEKLFNACSTLLGLSTYRGPDTLPLSGRITVGSTTFIRAKKDNQ